MKRLTTGFAVLSLLVALASGSVAMADTFGTGGSQFTLDFVPISGATNPTSGIPAGTGFTFVGVDHDYRMGTKEITNEQWDNFAAAYGAVTGNPLNAYQHSPYFPGANVPTNKVSWYEAAQFVNWLNTSTNHRAAYKFTGTQGTSDYTFAAWSTAEAAGGTNLYRHKDAYYFLPTEDEWVKAAYWNGTALQNYATKPGESLTQGNGTSGTGWNYYTTQYATTPYGPWTVGSGSQELNGTYDMMGNVWELMESPWANGNYGIDSSRGLRGGSFMYGEPNMDSFIRGGGFPPFSDYVDIGFRVASVPEPSTFVLVGMGAVGLLGFAWRRKRPHLTRQMQR